MSLSTDVSHHLRSALQAHGHPAARAACGGEDGSGERSAAALVAHVRNRVDRYLQAEVVHGVIEGFEQFEHGLPA